MSELYNQNFIIIKDGTIIPSDAFFAITGPRDRRFEEEE